mmetsp:Transcript_44523/g.123269  ORF Transcript_44523/g.123269 Transcript_44523/m.123269 type:complete len:465 (-) Transcript_44523:250-1644(-)
MDRAEDVGSNAGSIDDDMRATGSDAGSQGGTGHAHTNRLTIADCREKHMKCIQVLRRGAQTAALNATMKSRQVSDPGELKDISSLTPQRQRTEGCRTSTIPKHDTAVSPLMLSGNTAKPTATPLAIPLQAVADDPLVDVIRDVATEQARASKDLHEGLAAFREGLVSKIDSANESNAQGAKAMLETLTDIAKAQTEQIDGMKEMHGAVGKLHMAVSEHTKEFGGIKSQDMHAAFRQLHDVVRAQAFEMEGLFAQSEGHLQHVVDLRQALEAHSHALDEFQPKETRIDIIKLRGGVESHSSSMDELSKKVTAHHQAQLECFRKLHEELAGKERYDAVHAELVACQTRADAIKASNEVSEDARRQERGRLRDEVSRLMKREASLVHELQKAANRSRDGQLRPAPKGVLPLVLAAVSGIVFGFGVPRLRPAGLPFVLPRCQVHSCALVPSVDFCPRQPPRCACFPRC